MDSTNFSFLMMTHQMTILTIHRRSTISWCQSYKSHKSKQSQRKVLRKSTLHKSKKKHGQPHLPLLTSLKRERLEQPSENRVFAVTTFGVMVKNTTCDTLKCWYGNDIGHPSHAQITNNNSKQGITVKYSQSYSRITRVSQIDTTKQ